MMVLIISDYCLNKRISADMHPLATNAVDVERDIECCSFQSCSNSGSTSGISSDELSWMGHGLIPGGSSSFYIVPKRAKSQTQISMNMGVSKNRGFTTPNHLF